MFDQLGNLAVNPLVLLFDLQIPVSDVEPDDVLWRFLHTKVHYFDIFELLDNFVENQIYLSVFIHFHADLEFVRVSDALVQNLNQELRKVGPVRELVLGFDLLVELHLHEVFLRFRQAVMEEEVGVRVNVERG